MFRITCDCRKKTCISCVYFEKVEVSAKGKEKIKRLSEQHKEGKGGYANAPSATGRYWG